MLHAALHEGEWVGTGFVNCPTEDGTWHLLIICNHRCRCRCREPTSLELERSSMKL